MKLPINFNINKNVLYWICQISFWMFVGLFTLLTYFIQQGSSSPATIIDTTFTMLCLFGISHFYRYIIIKNNWLKLLFAKLLLRIVLATLFLSIIATPFTLLSSYIFNRESFVMDTGSILNNIITLIIFYFFWTFGYFLYHYVSNYNRNLKWEALINEFELNQLKSQLNPHFIFNALNTVKALVDEDPKKAKNSINQLSNILRNSLMMDKKKVIPFAEEMEIVKDYLTLEGTRYEERLKVHYNIDEAALTYKVPPMMLQTIVENGIKHGISRLKNGGEISINTEVDGNFLKLMIRNSGKYAPKEDRREGYGLKSTRQRLDLLYHQQASFNINNEKDKGVLTEIIIPKWDESEISVAR
ncbi:MAG: histidine kinase [Bacteroidota bacterium]